jgi:hypothetical protein
VGVFQYGFDCEIVEVLICDLAYVPSISEADELDVEFFEGHDRVP